MRLIDAQVEPGWARSKQVSTESFSYQLFSEHAAVEIGCASAVHLWCQVGDWRWDTVGDPDELAFDLSGCLAVVRAILKGVVSPPALRERVWEPDGFDFGFRAVSRPRWRLTK